MDKQKRNAGITLIALVISIIVMLILAGVSLNATVGDNGILKQAMDASNKQKLAQEMESLNLELAKLNIDTITNNEADTIQNIVDYLIKQGVIDEAVTNNSGAIAVGIDRETGSKYFFGKKGDHIYKISRGKDDILVAELTQSTSGGDIEGGSSLVTADSFKNDSSLPPEEKGKFTVTSDATVAFMDTISGELSIYVKSGVHAEVEIYADMTLTNAGIRRSAIDIEPGGTLDLYIGEGVTLTVNSGLASDAGLGVEGQGGYAGIHVPRFDTDTEIKKVKLDEDGNVIKNEQMEPEYDTYIQKAGIATLNITGSGVIKAYGGNASSGAIPVANRGIPYWYNMEGAGGGGAGAGIGGNGGNGGSGIHDPHPGIDGGKGEDCGNINIKENVTIYAYGGSGASGGYKLGGSAPGGGGYPAAGIGGGGAGGGSATDCTCSGGYSSATSNQNTRINNGLGAEAGGYYQGPTETKSYPEDISTLLGGIAAFGGGAGTASPYRGDPDNHNSGNGGQAGSGGNIKYVSGANIYAYNGNIFTDGTPYNDGENQAFIYAQSGKTVKTAKLAPCNNFKIVSGYTTQYTEEKNIKITGYINPNFKDSTEMRTFNLSESYSITKNMINQGIGSGAGYIEVDNGTYTLCNEVNGKLVPIEN